MCVTNTVNRRTTISLSPGVVAPTQRSYLSELRDISARSTVPAVASNTFKSTTVVPDSNTSRSVKPVPSLYDAFAPFQPPLNDVVEPPKAAKRKRKRKRKQQLPGKTAKMNDRHFVVHNYHDHAQDLPEDEQHSDVDVTKPRRRGGVAIAFPLKLHSLLDKIEDDGLAHVVSWQPHGRCFVVHKPKEFAEEVLPQYFRQTKITSFQRQLNLYGFNRITKGRDNGGYYHELFLRGKVFLSKRMTRTKVKGTGFKAASSPDNEPNFYSMPFVSFPSFPPTSSQVWQPSRTSGNEEFNSPRFEPSQSVPMLNNVVTDTTNLVSSSSSEGSIEPEEILEDAINEIMFEDDSDNRDDLMSDFAQIWNPHREVPTPPRIEGQRSFDIDPESLLEKADFIENDLQFGELLESLLQD